MNLSSIHTGFRIVEEVLSPEDCDQLLETISQLGINQARAGARHLLRVPIIKALANDPRLLKIARSELSGTAVPFRATLFHKSGKANWLVVWHQDTALPLLKRFDAPGWGHWSIKEGIPYAHAPAWALSRVVALRLHLDAVTSENGPLKVVPHSHTLGVLDDSEIAATVTRHGGVECYVRRGGVLVMRPLIIHSSSKAQTESPRRVLHIEYADALALTSSIHLAVA